MIGGTSNEDSEDMVESCTLMQLVSRSLPEHQIKLMEIVKKDLQKEPWKVGTQGKKAVASEEDRLKVFHLLSTNKWVVGLSAVSRSLLVSCSAKELVARSSVKDKRYLLNVLENNLCEERSEVTLFSADCRGGKRNTTRVTHGRLGKVLPLMVKDSIENF